MPKKGPKPNANPAQLRAARADGMDKTMVFCLTALADKHGFDREGLKEFIADVANTADSVSRGYVRYDELHRVLVDEQGLCW